MLTAHIPLLNRTLGDRRRVDGRGVGGLIEADFAGLAEQDHVGVVRPGVWVHFSIHNGVGV
jgi:hypothetical protein